jgi:hypothetical protein
VQVVGEWVLGGEDVRAGADVGVLAAGGLNEFLDRPAGVGPDVVGDGQCGEHDRKLGVDGFALVVIDRPGFQVVLGHSDALLDVPELVGADHEIRCRVGGVGDVALPAGQRACFAFEFAVHGLVGTGQGDEPVAWPRTASLQRKHSEQYPTHGGRLRS